MSILDREREIAHTQNQIKHSTCTVYTASPEELEKLLNGRHGMGRTKGSKNKPHDITVNEKRQALQSKIEKQKNEREAKQNEVFENILSLPKEGQPTSVPPHAEIQIIPIVDMQPEACLVPDEKVKSDTAAVTAEFVGRSKEIADEINQIASQALEDFKAKPTAKDEESVIHKQCMEILKGQYKTACSCAAYRLLSDEIVRMSAESAVEVLSNIIEVSILFRKEILSIGAAKSKAGE